MPSPSPAESLESQVRARIEGLSYLPTTAAVAMKFVELGRNPDAEPGEYTKVISSDGSLASKLLALSNSSWFGVRNRVTKVQVAVNLLGLGTVRAMAISYCLTGLHSELRLTPDESRLLWSASLCKAVAAKRLAARVDTTVAEEAFAAGLFQDFALPVMFSVARPQVTALLADVSLGHEARLARERELFRLDHAELARAVAQKLELPELFVDAVAFHHNRSSLAGFVERGPLADAVYAASLFPHTLDAWNRQDAEELRAVLAAQPKPADPAEFLAEVQAEFDQLYAYFERGTAPEHKLAELLEMATREAADSTARLVGTVHELLNQAAAAGKEVHTLLRQHEHLEDAAAHDSLTGALNREGFAQQAGAAVREARRGGKGLALLYLDVDKFKEINDRCGHARGDAALRRVVESVRRHLRPGDLVARLGGDEFVALLIDYSDAEVVQAAGRMLQAAAKVPPAAPAAEPDPAVTLSAGIAYAPPGPGALALDELIKVADGLMYKSKRAGGNRANASRLRPAPKAA